MRTFLARVRALVRARQLDEDLRREIAGHLEEATEEYLRQGLTPAEARRAALRSFGGVAQAEDAYREHLSFRWLDHWRRDARHAVRALCKSAGFSLVVVIVLATGTGAITSVFTLLNRIVLRPLPFAQPDRLIVIQHSAPGVGLEQVGLSSGLYFYYLEHARSLESLAVYSRENVLNLAVPGAAAERVHVTYAGAALFQVLEATPALGRLFTVEDGRPGFMNMTWTVPILLAHDFWVDHFGADPGVVGRVLTINDSPRRIVGVLPEGFAFPDRHTQVWMLLEPPRNAPDFARRFSYNAVARMRPGVTAASAQAELARILPRIAGVYRDATPQRIAEVRLAPVVTPLKSAVIRDVAQVLWTLFGGMALLLMIACANVAGLFLVRAEGRRREIAVRQALGATSRHVARLFFTEALVLTTAAAVLGLLLAKSFVSAVIALVPAELPRTAEIRLDAAAVVFAGGVAVLMAAFYGALSVRRQGRPAAASLLSGGHWATGHRGGHRGRDPFIVLQVALALALIVGSALMVKTYRNLARRELGFAPARVLTVDVGLPSRKYRQHARIYQNLAERVRGLPGVESASAASFVPLTISEHVFPVQAAATPVVFKFFTPGYFQTIRTPIVAGESFAAGERVTAPNPVLVSAALARRLYPGERAVGQPVRRLNQDGSIVDVAGPVPPFTIAGIVGDVRETTLRDDPTEIVYIPVIEPAVERSIVPTDMTLIVRTQGPPLALAAAVRAAIAETDPGLRVGEIRTMDSIVRAARAREAFVGVLLLVAAAVSVLLGVVGVYGSVAHVVKRRTREIGIRMALGARRAEVIRMVATGSIRAVLTGAALGLAVALTGTGMLRALLFGVEPRDPGVFLVVTAVLLSAAIAATVLSALRATRTDPMIALRSEN